MAHNGGGRCGDVVITVPSSSSSSGAEGGPRPPQPPPPTTTTTKKREEDPNATLVNIPTLIHNTGTGAAYVRGRLLGKGGFARCYEVTEQKTGGVFACKVVNKTLLIKDHQREKMAQEIKIHRTLRHEFVVNFLTYFEDSLNVYITLELCSKKSLMELQKRRRAITEPEAKYFMRQIVLACSYLHDEKHIIHRDLKLGNIFISENMCLKIGDFGLATTIEYDGERKKTLCGTPNYIAPEVLSKKGHSYEVDIWSVGCILYTLLVGRPPFETATLKDTYHRIKRGEYFYPQNMKISQGAKTLLAKLLQVNPALRPRARNILYSEFMTQGHMPTTLPTSVLTMAPRFEDKKYVSGVASGSTKSGSSGVLTSTLASAAAPATVTTAAGGKAGKKPLMESNQGGQHGMERQISAISTMRALLPSATPTAGEGAERERFGELTNIDVLESMVNLRNQIKKLLDSRPPLVETDDESEDPCSAPLVWICKWVDYSDKYGFGYHLSDDSIGVSFNDHTKIALLSDAKSMHYIDREGSESYHRIDNYPEDLIKKVKLLKYFQQYMQDNLMKATGGREPAVNDCIARVPNMWTWFRTSRSVVMVLSNGTLQINNFRDHSKMILCPLLGALTILDSNKDMQTHKLSAMDKGLTREMVDRLKYAFEKVATTVDREVEERSANGGSPPQPHPAHAHARY